MKKIEVKYHEPGGIIWKVLPDEEGKYLVIESRDGERRRTLLSVFSVGEERFIFKEVTTPLPWWIGLKAVGVGKIVLQGFKESQSPEPNDVYVLELLTGKLLWKITDKLFYSFSGKETLLVSDQREELPGLYEVALSSGEIMSAIEEKKGPIVFETNSIFPLLYSQENRYYATISEYIQQCGYKNVGPIEYLEYEGRIFISFYVQEGKKVINILLVVDEEGKILLTDTLTEGAEGIGMSSYFIFNHSLVYIKNKTSIVLAKL